MGLKRSVADGVERLLGVSIAPQHRVGEIYERDQVRKVFDSFAIDCVFDVGANTGQYYRFLRDMVGFAGPVISYEPTPALVADLTRNASRDNAWHVNAIALDRAAGEATFHVARDTQFSSLRTPGPVGMELFSDGRMEGDAITVKTETLAREIARWRDRLGFQRPYLKLDTQGHDLAVAEGAGDALAVFVAIQSEAAIVPIYSDAPGIVTALNFFTRRGFAPCAFVPNNEGHFPRLIETDIIFVNQAAAGLPTPSFNDLAGPNRGTTT
jgi:FkbM family methyltransferase